MKCLMEKLKYDFVYSENVHINLKFHAKGTTVTKVVEVFNREET